MKINKFIYSLLAVSVITLSASSKNITDYFFDMPAYLLPSLESSYRLELAENKQARDIDTIQNKFGTTVRLLSLDTVHNHISLQATPNARFEMCLFGQNSDTVIGIIHTVCGPVCSSYIRFYDKEWREKSVKLPAISANDWLKSREVQIDGVKITDMVQTSFIEYTFKPENGSIEAKNNSLDFLDMNDKTLLEPYFENRVFELYQDGNTLSFIVKK